jgi:hypothetical protein
MVLGWLLALAGASALVAVGVLRDARAASPEPLLPNLVADPPDGAELATSSIEGHTHLLLRFNGYIHNDGPGALDIRGARAHPQVQGMDEAQVNEEVRTYKGFEQTMPANIEAELAVPAMHVSQRLYTTNEGEPKESERYLERPHVEEATAGEMIYSNADGHHHWHLQHVASYSLWNDAKTAEVAPSQKVGFCLEDIQHIEPDKGPATPVYAHNAPPYPGFCRRWEPNSTSVYEGISPGWRDIYPSEVAFQWVDVSDVAPGEYWLREDVDPEHVLQEAGGGPKYAYSISPVVIPGFDAEGQGMATDEDEAKTITLSARAYDTTASPVFRIYSQPEHGSLSVIHDDQLTYTPESGYAGSDSFTYSASDPESEFPQQPELATVSISVNSMKPTIAIDGGQQQMIAGTGTQLTAAVTHDTAGVEWQASAGTIVAGGFSGGEALYTAPAAPPAGGGVTITARLLDDPSIYAQRTIVIEPQPVAEPQPEPPAEGSTGAGAGSGSGTGTGTGTGSGTGTGTGSGAAGTGSGSSSSTAGSGGGGSGERSSSSPDILERARAASISRPRAMLVGHELVMSTVPSVAGFVRLTATLRGRRLGSCSTNSVALRTFTCRLRLRAGISPLAPISVRATLQVGKRLLQATLPAHRVPEMRMRTMGEVAEASGRASLLWCSPSTLTSVLVG